MCNRLCKAFKPRIFNRHSYFCFPIQMFRCGILLSQPYLDSGFHVLLWVRRFCFHIFRLRQGFFHIHNSFTDLLVSVVFFLHFRNVEFIPWSCVPTVSVIVCRNVSIFSSVFFEWFPVLLSNLSIFSTAFLE